jgi:trigger factor
MHLFYNFFIKNLGRIHKIPYTYSERPKFGQYSLEENMSENLIQVKLGNYKGIQVKKTEVVITDEEVQAELVRACQLAAKNVEKIDAPAEMGDETVIDFVGYIDGEAFEGGDGTDFPLKLGSGTFIPGFEEQLVGAKKGDQVDVTLPFPENYHAAEFAGRDAIFKVTVKEIRTYTVPEMSDEVAAQVSNCKTVEEFIEHVKGQIRNYKEEQAQIEKENAILEQIVKDSEITVPDEAVDERVAALKRNLEAQLRNGGNTFEQYLQYNGITEETFQEYAKRDALSMLKGESVLAEIAKAEGFSYTQEEIDKEVADMARSYQMDVEQFVGMVGDHGVKMIGEDYLAKKALEFINAQAVEI